MQSAYHNLPVVNGVQQKDGKQYAARLINRSNGSLTLDIAGAYPRRLPSGRGGEYSPAQLCPEIEDVSGKMDALLHGVWGQEMYRVVLTVKAEKLKNKINYRLSTTL